MKKIVIALCACFSFTENSFAGGFLAETLKQVDPANSAIYEQLDKANGNYGSPIEGGIVGPYEIPDGTIGGGAYPEVTGMPLTNVPKCCLPKK